MQGFSGGVVGQHTDLTPSNDPHSSDPSSKTLISVMRSAQVAFNPSAAYGAKSSPAVAPSRQIKQGFTTWALAPLAKMETSAEIDNFILPVELKTLTKLSSGEIIRSSAEI
jgi:hypothetical protein